MKKKTSIGIAACLIELNGAVPSEIRLTPAGRFKAKDGRPHNLSGWVINEALASNVISASKTQDRTLIDYDHQTLYTRENGKQAPASGWFDRMEWREDGLYALGVEWTDTATQAILSKEYRYISPVLSYDQKTGEVTSVLMAALVNYPAIDGLTDLAVAHFNFNQEESPKMDEEQLKLLGLAKEATSEEVTAALGALITASSQVEALGAEINALKAKPDAVDPAKFVPVETMTAMQTQLAALSAQINDKEKGGLIADALSDGRLLPAQKTWAESLTVEALSAFIATAQPIAALSGLQTAVQKLDDKGVAVLSAEQEAICDQMGIDHEEYKKTLGAK